MRIRPRIFIGSSQEAYNNNYSQDIQIELSKWSDAQTWPSIFQLCDTPIQSLEEQLPLFDAFVFILTPDDILKMRKHTYLSARDNILFEMGIAMGLKGRKNTFIVKQKIDENSKYDNKNLSELSGKNLPSEISDEIKLPTDLLGVCYAQFSPGNKADYETLSNKIKNKYFETHPETAEDSENGKIQDFVGEIKGSISKIHDTVINIDKTLGVDIDVLAGALESGVVSIYPSRNDPEKGRYLNNSIIKEFNCIIKEFKTVQNTLYIQGITLKDYFHKEYPMYKHFMDLIESECPCKVLIVGPRSKALVDRVYWEYGPASCKELETFMKSPLYRDAEDAVLISQELKEAYPALEVRCYSHVPTCFLILTNNFVFTESYTYTKRGSNSPSLQIANRNGIYDLYKKHFDNLWGSATPVEDYDLSQPMNPDWFMIGTENKYDRRVI